MVKYQIICFWAITLVFSSDLFGRPDFEEMKVHRLKMLEGKISIMKADQLCIQKAKTRDDLRSCKEEARKKKREMKQSGQKERMAKIRQKIEKECQHRKRREAKKRFVDIEDCIEKGLSRHRRKMGKRGGKGRRGRGRGKGRGRDREDGPRDWDKGEGPEDW